MITLNQKDFTKGDKITERKSNVLVITKSVHLNATQKKIFFHSIILFFISLNLFIQYLLFLDDPTAKRQITAAMNDWTTRTKGCITFKKRTNEAAYVSMFRGSG